MSKKIISAKKKFELLQQLAVPGCVVSKLAKSYNVGISSIYKWKKECGAGASNKFVELAVKETFQQVSLKKVAFEFDQFSLNIEGKIRPSAVLMIMQILEQEGC